MIYELVQAVDFFGGKSLGSDAVMVKCPCHADKTESLKLWIKDDGHVGNHCFAGCSFRDVDVALVSAGIDVEKMRAINLPHFKLKLRDISRELYLEHGWKMPQGLVNSNERNPLNFTQAEWQQAKRIKQDSRIIKQTFQDCWAISDSRAAFASALEERGYYLAKGDRRGFVAVDWRGEVYPISRWAGIKAKEVKSKLGKLENLPSVEETKRKFATQFTDKLQSFVADTFAAHEKAEQSINARRQSLTENHQHQRAQLKLSHATRWIQEAKIRSALLPTGL